MKLLFTFLALIITLISDAQNGAQIILYSKITIDSHTNNGKFLFRVIDNRIIYTYDTLKQKYISSPNRISAFESIGNDTTDKGILKRYYQNYFNEFSPVFFTNLKRELETDKFIKTDTSNVRTLFVHTSHHYADFYVTIIENNDTITYYKSKPFDTDTPWYKDGTLIVNTTIDKMVMSLLPYDFLQRKSLNPDNTKPDDYISYWNEMHKLFKKYWKRGKKIPLQ